jgi:hypothetical protein
MRVNIGFLSATASCAVASPICLALGGASTIRQALRGRLGIETRPSVYKLECWNPMIWPMSVRPHQRREGDGAGEGRGDGGAGGDGRRWGLHGDALGCLHHRRCEHDE